MAHKQRRPPHPGDRQTLKAPKTSRVVRPDDDKRTGQSPPEDVDSPAAMPHGTAHDQVTDMENAGQAQKHGNGW